MQKLYKVRNSSPYKVEHFLLSKGYFWRNKPKGKILHPYVYGYFIYPDGRLSFCLDAAYFNKWSCPELDTSKIITGLWSRWDNYEVIQD